MSLLGALTDKPWLSPGIGARATVIEDEAQRRAADAGVFLGVFLGVVTALFSLVASAYVMRMGVHGPLDHGAADWARIAEPPLLWVNTGVLVLSSVALQMAVDAARKGSGRALGWLIAGGLLAIAFLVGQVVVWRQIDTAGHFLALHAELCTAVDNPFARPAGPLVSGNPAAAFFYLITGLHGLHILGGLVGWARTTLRALKGVSGAALEWPVTLCARYWHFLLLVWIVMFGLLLMT